MMDESWSDLVDAERSRQDARWGGYPHDSQHTDEDWNEISERFVRRAFAAGSATDWGGFREALVQVMAVAAARRETILKRILAAAITARV
jgi:hypothetical protein